MRDCRIIMFVTSALVFLSGIAGAQDQINRTTIAEDGADCARPDPPIRCILGQGGGINGGGAVLHDIAPLELRIERFNDMAKPDFRLNEGRAY